MFKLLSEIGPVVAFFTGFLYGGGIQNATLYMFIAPLFVLLFAIL